jgi:hypothetical protein
MGPLKKDSREFAVFKKACDRRGLETEGFDVLSETIDPDVTNVLVKLGGKEYRYSGGDPSWAEKFFMDIGDDGDSGDGVEVITSEQERGEA